jgi:soluble lytic murein transglycosylase-like protein
MRPVSPTRLLRRRPTALLAVAFVLTGYTVQSGDTLSELAQRFDVALDALSEANGLNDPDRLIAGTRLDMPSPAPVDAGEDEPPVGSALRTEVDRLLTRTARAYGWSPAFVKAVAWQESGWQQDVVSPKGAVGIMQVMPGTADFVASRRAGRELDLNDPRDNVLAGVLFLDYLYDLTGGDAEATLAGYYQGLASVREHGRFADTQRYIDNVLALRERFR